MKRWLIGLTAGLLMSMSLVGAAFASGGSEWEHVPPHGHVMLQDVELSGPLDTYVAPGPFGEETLYGVFEVSYRRCVELAKGKALPTPAHHHGIHTGAAGDAQRERAGNEIVPLTPLFPATGCDDMPQSGDTVDIPLGPAAPPA